MSVLPETLHGRWLTVGKTESFLPYAQGVQVMELIKEDLSWSYDTNYLFSLPRKVQEKTGNYSSEICRCQFRGTMTAVDTQSDFTDYMLRWMRRVYKRLPDYRISFRLTEIEFVYSPNKFSQCPKFIAEANKQNLSAMENAYSFGNYMELWRVCLSS